MDKFSVLQSKILTLHEITKLVMHWRLKNQKIVFTNGCFDIIHYGHVNYLAQAASLGNKLIVGLNSDSSVKMLNKAASRPIQDENSRATILAAMSFVSAIILFNEATPYHLIRTIRPDVLAKGGDWKREQIIGSDVVLSYDGLVESIPFIDGFSTSLIEKKIVEANR